MAVRKEMVLYYTPEKSADDQKRKGVLVRLGIRIRNIAPEQAGQQVRPRQDLGPAVGEKGDGQVKNSLKGSAVDLLDGMHTHMGSSVEQICSKFRAMTPRAR